MIIYGAGELGKLASEFFEFYNLNCFVCDDNPENYKDDEYWLNDKIYKIDSIADKDIQVVVCISTASYKKIKNKLNDKGFRNVKPFYQVAEVINKANDYGHPLTNGWKIKKHNEKSHDFIESNFKDIHSQYAYTQFFDWHDEYKEETSNFYPIECDNRYFIPEVMRVLHDHETFIDVGAYDGRVSKKFTEKVKGKYESIYMFEPDLANFYGVLDTFGLESERINLFNSALGNKKGYVNFLVGKGYCSKVWKKAKHKEIMVKLDSISINPTFIKYHLEGYELEAIKGSIKTIKKNRPILAVTTYHTEEGLYKLPMYLIKNLKDYNFYWRNHNYQGQGAVMYCIPKERTK